MNELIKINHETSDRPTVITQKIDISETTVKELKAEIEKLKAEKQNSENQLTELNEKNRKLAEKNSDLENEIEELSDRPIEVAVKDDSQEVEKMRKAMAKLDSEHDAEMTKIQEDNIKAIRRLNDEHNAAVSRLKTEYEQRIAEAEKSAEKSSEDTKAVFKAYLLNAVDSAKRLIEFVKANPDELYKNKTTDFFKTIIREV